MTIQIYYNGNNDNDNSDNRPVELQRYLIKEV